MAEHTTSCPFCKMEMTVEEAHLGLQADCPGCGREFTLSIEDSAPPPPPLRMPTPTAADLRPLGSVQAQLQETLPERMQANHKLAGRSCPGCARKINLDEEVFNCPKCKQTMHLHCYESRQSCASKRCQEAKTMADAPPVQLGDNPEIRRPTATTSATRGRGERRREERPSKPGKRPKPAGNPADDNLDGGEILFGIICAGLACIVSIVWMIQGKKKGLKLFCISLIAQIVWTILRVLATGSIE